MIKLQHQHHGDNVVGSTFRKFVVIKQLRHVESISYLCRKDLIK